MKLTRSQRLFIKAGEAQARIMQYKYNIVYTNGRNGPDTIAYYRKKRKQYIKLALDAARSENTEHFNAGVNLVLETISRNQIRKS